MPRASQSGNCSRPHVGAVQGAVPAPYSLLDSGSTSSGSAAPPCMLDVLDRRGHIQEPVQEAQTKTGAKTVLVGSQNSLVFVLVLLFVAGGQMVQAQQSCTFNDNPGVIIHQGGDTVKTCPSQPLQWFCTGASKCTVSPQGYRYCTKVHPLDGYCIQCQDGYALGKCGPNGDE